MNPMDRIKDVYHVKTTPAITANYLHFSPIFSQPLKLILIIFFYFNQQKVFPKRAATEARDWPWWSAQSSVCGQVQPEEDEEAWKGL